MSMPDWGIVAVPVIAVICFLIGEAVKLAPINKDWIPVICGFCGGILGVIAMKFMPDFPAHDVLTAIAVGIVSGWGAVGVYETWKNLAIKIPKEEKEIEKPMEAPEEEYDNKH